MATHTHPRREPETSSRADPHAAGPLAGSSRAVADQLPPRITPARPDALTVALLRAENAALRARLAADEGRRAAVLAQYEAIIERHRRAIPDDAPAAERRQSADGPLSRLRALLG